MSLRYVIKHGSKYYIGTTEQYTLACHKESFGELSLPYATKDEVNDYDQKVKLMLKNRELEKQLKDLKDTP